MRKEIQEWIEKGNRTEAVRLLEEWVGKHPADEEEWLLLGELLYADGKMTEALNKFNTQMAAGGPPLAHGDIRLLKISVLSA